MTAALIRQLKEAELGFRPASSSRETHRSPCGRKLCSWKRLLHVLEEAARTSQVALSQERNFVECSPLPCYLLPS